MSRRARCCPWHPHSFGGIGVFAIPEMNRFYRHVLIRGAAIRTTAQWRSVTSGKAFFALMQVLGIQKVGFNQPAGMLYKTENPFK